MDNYRVYLSARVQCFKSSHRVHSLGASLDSGVDLDVCTSWYGVTHVLPLPNSSKCGVGNILVESGSCKTPPYFARSVPSHRDKAETKCMGPVGGKHRQNQKCICSSPTLSIVSKTKLMDNKIMSVAFKTFVTSDRSTWWKDNLSILMFFYIVQRLRVQHFSSYD